MKPCVKLLFIVGTLLGTIILGCSLYLTVFSPDSDDDLAAVWLTPSSPMKLEAHKKRTLRYDYPQLINLSLIFYESMRSGKLPADNRVPWRGDSCLDCKGPGGSDLSKGYYDYGHVVFKSIYNNSLTVANLGWGLIELGEVYQNISLLDRTREAIVWGADYLVNVRHNDTLFSISTPSRPEDPLKLRDDDFWGRPEEATQKERKARPYTDNRIAARDSFLAAAALAVSSMVVNETDPTRAEKYLTEANELYQLGEKIQSSLLQSSPEFHLWATLWLFKADRQNSQKFNNTISNYSYLKLNNVNLEGISGQKIKEAAKVIFYENFGGDSPTKLCRDIFYDEQKLTKNKRLHLKLYETGMADISDIVGICLFLDSFEMKAMKTKIRFLGPAVQQINLMLGDLGRSFVTGFGHRPPSRVRHMASSCPDRPLVCNKSQLVSESANPQPLLGALVFGPDANDSYSDSRSHQENSVGIIYNAGYQATLAVFTGLHLNKTLPEEAYNYHYSFTYHVNASVRP